MPAATATRTAATGGKIIAGTGWRRICSPWPTPSSLPVAVSAVCWEGYRRLAWVSGLFGAAPYRLFDLLPVPVREDGRSQLALHTAKGLAQANPLHVQAALGGAALSDMPDPGQLRDLDIPTLILAWEDDTAHPVSTAAALADTLPDVRGMVLCHPGDIGEWNSALVSFVKGVAGKPPAKRAPARNRRAAAKPTRSHRKSASG